MFMYGEALTHVAGREEEVEFYYKEVLMRQPAHVRCMTNYGLLISRDAARHLAGELKSLTRNASEKEAENKLLEEGLSAPAPQAYAALGGAAVDAELASMLKLETVRHYLGVRAFRWFGHVVRMDRARLP